MTCKGPGCGVEWTCDMQHGIVDGRCTTCQIMAEAASNLSPEEVMAVLGTVDQAKRRDDNRELRRALVTAKAVLETALADHRGEVPPADALGAWQRSILDRLQAGVVRYLQVDGSHGLCDAIECGNARRRLIEIVGEIKPLTFSELVAERRGA